MRISDWSSDVCSSDLLRHCFADRLYLEIARCGRVGDDDWVDAAVALSRHEQIPLVATNDVRFLAQDDFETHEARVCLAQGRVLNDPKRPRSSSNQQYLKSPAEMAELFAHLPDTKTGREGKSVA